MSRPLTSVICLSVVTFGIAAAAAAQDKGVPAPIVASRENSDRALDGLIGSVRRVRVEIAKIMVKEAKTLEGPRTTRAITTYDPIGHRIDTVTYPSDANKASGKEQYRYDDKGNITEMTLRGEDGSLVSKEIYRYDFDELGNWKKMVRSIAIYENGNLGYEPVEVTYRTITYYFDQSVAKVVKAGETSISKTTTVASENLPTQIEKPTTPQRGLIGTAGSEGTGEPESHKKVNEPTAERTGENQARVVPAPVAAKEEPAQPAVVRVSEEALRKSVIELPQPEYPTEAKLAGIEGKVEVQFLIDENGDVTVVRPISGNALLTEAAASAARRARFSPSKLSSQPARVFGSLTYEFVLPRKDPVMVTPVETGKVSAPETLTRSSSEVPTAVPIENSSKPPKEMVPSASAVSAISPTANTSRKVVPPMNPLTIGTPFEKGMASIASANYTMAVEFFRQAIQADPNDALAHYKLGLAYSALNQPEKTITAYSKAIRLKRAFATADAYYRLGSAYLSRGDHASAVEPLKQSLYMIRAKVLDTGSDKAAFGDPTEGEAHYALGLAYYGSDSYRSAASEFQSAIRKRADFAPAHYGLGLACLGYGDKRCAQKEEEALRKLKSPMADKLTSALLRPAGQKNRVF
jgi:TonB family protein